MMNTSDWTVQIYRSRFLKNLNLSGTFFEKTIDIPTLDSLLAQYFSGMANYAFSYVSTAMKYGKAYDFTSIYRAWREGETAYAKEMGYPWLGIEEENRLQWRAMQSWNYYQTINQGNNNPIESTTATSAESSN